jgi:hypothetical protein
MKKYQNIPFVPVLVVLHVHMLPVCAIAVHLAGGVVLALYSGNVSLYMLRMPLKTRTC